MAETVILARAPEGAAHPVPAHAVGKAEPSEPARLPPGPSAAGSGRPGVGQAAGHGRGCPARAASRQDCPLPASAVSDRPIHWDGHSLRVPLVNVSDTCLLSLR